MTHAAEADKEAWTRSEQEHIRLRVIEKQMREQHRLEDYRMHQWMMGGLSAAALAGLLTIAATGPVTTLGMIAFAMFSAAVPITCGALFFTTVAVENALPHPMTRTADYVDYASVFTVVGGYVFLTLNVSRVSGLVFFAASIFAGVTAYLHINKAWERRSKEEAHYNEMLKPRPWPPPPSDSESTEADRT